jgi:hypothetical protein
MEDLGEAKFRALVNEAKEVASAIFFFTPLHLLINAIGHQRGYDICDMKLCRVKHQ